MEVKKFDWPLNVSNFSYFDRLKIAKFLLTKKNYWTQGEKVKEFEKAFAEYVYCKHAVFVSSGSTANTLLAMYVKDNEPSFRIGKNVVVLPSVTWQTSCSPWIREGFSPKFIDVSTKDFSMDTDKLDEFLKENHVYVACVFVTALLGFTPDVKALKAVCSKYKVRLMMDNCENTFGTAKKYGADHNISSFTTSTTSTYFGHQLQSVEGGFIFTNFDSEYEYFLMARNHGMVRSINGVCDPAKYRNNEVDARFDFNMLGNNFRNTDLNAFIGLLDFEKRFEYARARKHLYDVFKRNLDPNKYYLPPDGDDVTHIPFALPVIAWPEVKDAAVVLCQNEGIETRPIISGNLLRQTPYKKYGNCYDFPNAELLHRRGFYVGLYSSLSEKKVLRLAQNLNRI